MTIVLTLIAYTVAAVFYLRFIWRFVLWSRLEPDPAPAEGRKPFSLALTVFDVLFLRRLFAVNPILWFGEWVFHVSFVIVFINHLRYVFLTPPWFVVLAAPLAKVTSITLPLALLYILLFRALSMAFTKDYFTSRYNLFLTSAILLTAVTGFFLRHTYRTDMVRVKEYALGVLAFRPVGFPDSIMFALHFALALLVIVLVPTHIFTAPLVSFDAARRDTTIQTLIHDNEK